AAADQAHLPEWCDVTFEAEGSRTRQEVAKCLRIDGYFNLLLTDQRMPKVDVASHAKLVRGIDAYAAIAFYHFESLQASQETALAPKAANSAMVEQLHERLGGAVEDRHFNGVDIDEDVVDAARVDSREQMFRCGEQNALLHQARGIAHACNVMPLRFDREVVEIDAA